MAIARALAMDPKVILLRRADLGARPGNDQEVLDVMVQLAHDGMTMVVVTHEMGFARKAANRVLFMADGQIVEEARPNSSSPTPQARERKTSSRKYSPTNRLVSITAIRRFP